MNATACGPRCTLAAPQRIGRLERMLPLDAAPTGATLPNMDLKPADVGPHDRQLFLDLIGDATFVERATARRAVRRQRHVDRFVDVWRRLAMAVAPMAATRSTAGDVRMRRGRTFGERRGLPIGRPAREIEFLLQSFVLAPEARILALDPFALLPFVIPFTLRALGTFTPLPVSRIVALGHGAFMADSRK